MIGGSQHIGLANALIGIGWGWVPQTIACCTAPMGSKSKKLSLPLYRNAAFV
jgi:hypothetical protein